MPWPYWRARLRACLIDDLRQAHQFWSLWFALAGIVFSASCIALPPMVATDLGALALFTAILIARLLHQGGNGDD